MTMQKALILWDVIERLYVSKKGEWLFAIIKDCIDALTPGL